MTFGGAGLAFADSPTCPGTPGAPNCHGQTIAYLAQLGPTYGFAGGIGNLATEYGLTVQEIQASVDSYCGSSATGELGFRAPDMWP